MHRLNGLLGLAALCALTGAAEGAGPSFDCGKAGSWAEKTICQNDELAGAACLTDRYREFIADLEGRLAGPSTASTAPAAKPPLDECAGKADASACRERLIEAEESNLAIAESAAQEAAVARDQATQTTHIADRLAEANVAWRGYRNAECKRRQEAAASAADGAVVYSDCLVALTRQRILQLQM